MSLSLAARRARLLAVRGLIDAHDGGALWLLDGTMAPNPETPPDNTPIAIIALAAVSCSLHATLAQMTLVTAQGFAARAGVPTWCRLVDGAGSPVHDDTAGPPGSGAAFVVTNGNVPPSAQMYTGGEVNVTATFVEP